MLEIVARGAALLLRVRSVLWSIAGFGILVFGWGLISGQQTGPWILGGLILLIWTSFLLALAHLFGGRELAGATRPADGFVARLWRRVHRVLLWVAMIVIGLAGLLLLLFSFRALNAI